MTDKSTEDGPGSDIAHWAGVAVVVTVAVAIIATVAAGIWWIWSAALASGSC